MRKTYEMLVYLALHRLLSVNGEKLENKNHILLNSMSSTGSPTYKNSRMLVLTICLMYPVESMQLQ